MYKDNPFGNPDGSRADISEITSTFITDRYYGVSFTQSLESLVNKRVIVGAKGSGKTVYLRKIKSYLEDTARIKDTGIYI